MFFILLPGFADAQVTDTWQLSASDAVVGDQFGTTVSMDGDQAISGAPAANKAYIYAWNGLEWVETQTLTGSDTAAGDQFGHAVSLHEDRLIVGAPEKGSVYVFDWDGTTWNETAILTPAIPQVDAMFGGSVSLYEDRILIGAWGEDILGEVDQGAAYVFDWDGVQWNETAKITGSDSDAGDRFGWSVAAYADRALVGAPMYTMDGFLLQGTAYFFEWDTSIWNQVGQWYNPTGFPEDQFGYSVAIHGDMALIGEPFFDFEGNDGQGMAHLLEWTGTQWQGAGELLQLNGEAGDNFGYSVALDDELLVIGARGKNVMGMTGAGSAYLFEFQGTGWFQRTQIYEDNAGDTHHFGSSVAISNRRIFAGVQQGDKLQGDVTLVDASGTGYMFQLEDHIEGIAIYASDGDVGDNFGAAVSIHNDRAIIGALRDYTNPFLVGGAAYIYEWDGAAWVEMQKLGSSSPGRESYFGRDVAIDGDRALATAQDAGDFVAPEFDALVYVFDWDGTSWVETEIIDIPEPDGMYSAELYHFSVALQGDRALVGVNWLDHALFKTVGGAFMYEWDGTTWNLVSELIPSAGILSNGFGSAVSLHKDLALVGALNQDSKGAAYMFEWDGITWNEIATLTASDGQEHDTFGLSVALHEDRALVGAENHEVDGVDLQGAAYLFERSGDTWNEVAELSASSGAEEDYFGTSLAIQGDLIVVGNRRSDEIGLTDAGSAVVFAFNGTEWIEYTRLHENYANTDNQFGRDVAISGNRVLAGAFAGDRVNEDGTVLSNTGAAHAFELNFDIPDDLPGELTASPLDIDFGFVGNETSSTPVPVTLTNTGTLPIDVTGASFNGADADHFSHSLTDVVTIAGGATSTIDVFYTPQLPATDVVAEGVLYRVNAGGSTVEDWNEDSEEVPSPYLLPGSTTIETTRDDVSTDASVPEGTPLDLFVSKRLDANQAAPAMEWDFPLAAGGEYEVRLYFIELSRCSVGNRIFDVEIEGVKVLDEFDIYSEAGNACKTGIMRSHTLVVEDDNLDINFPLFNGKPSAVAGIEIITLTPPIINQSAALSIEHTGSNGSAFVNLVGETGIASEQEESTLSVSPESVVFDVTEEGAFSEAVTLTLSNDGTSSIDITSVSLAGTNEGDFAHTFTTPVTLGGGTTSTIDVAFAPQPTAASSSLSPPMLDEDTVLFRVNAGGALVDDWEEDTADIPSSYLLAGSAGIETDGVTPTLDATVPVGTPLDLFTHKRIDANKPEPYMEWDFPVEVGTELVVNLFFVEMSRCSAGARVFDVTIDGVVVLDDFDAYVEAGSVCNQGTMRSVTVTATDDNLDVDFPLVNGKPAVVAAIEVIASGTPVDVDIRSADLVIEHNGANPALSIALSGEAVPSTDTGDNVGPVAAFTYEYAPEDPSGNNAILVDVSTDSDEDIVTRQWDVAGTGFVDESVATFQDPDTPFTVTLTVTDDDGETSTVTETITLSQITLTEIDGMVVFEAESYFTNEPFGTHSWVEHTGVEGFSGAAAMQAQPNDGTTSNGIQSTHMTYEANFTTGGTYYLWARVYAETTNDNSVHFGDNGAATAVKANQNTLGEWSWTNLNTKSKALTVDLSSGMNTIDVWMREDGLVLDKLVVTTDELFVAEGLGPDESQRKGIAVATNAPDEQLAGVAEESNAGSKLNTEQESLPESFVLHANYPNPFNPVTTIEFEVPEATAVRLEVFDMMGRRVATLVDQQLDAGRHQARWDARSDAGSPVASGVYIYRIQAGHFEAVQQMILMK